MQLINFNSIPLLQRFQVCFDLQNGHVWIRKELKYKYLWIKTFMVIDHNQVIFVKNTLFCSLWFFLRNYFRKKSATHCKEQKYFTLISEMTHNPYGYYYEINGGIHYWMGKSTWLSLSNLWYSDWFCFDLILHSTTFSSF